ncbi:hypothetical protein C2E23DRAFT_887840 [Lenzites betulinus]|nr:hypothetical protein C2E23DRAFT_887840 [Lenzites betulinus]
MSQVVVRHVTTASESEVALYAKVVAEAFEYQYFSPGLGGDRSLQLPFLIAHLNAALKTGEGEVHVAELPGVGAAGVALWFGPGHKFLATEAQRKQGWDDIMNGLDPKYSGWWDTFLTTYDILVEKSLGPGVKLGGYHLQLIGVSPEHQKKGVAKALTDFAEAKATRVPSVLETVGATNVTIYKALKYEVAGSGPIQSPPPYDHKSFTMFVFIKHTEDEAYTP